ncbi:MAG: hypothetical protein U0176_10180, partial [Bacteroidia bacterium]
NFFMTSLGLNGVVTDQWLSPILRMPRIGVRKIGDFLRNAVQKGVDIVVNLVKDKFKGLFKRRGGNAEGDDDDSENEGSNKPVNNANLDHWKTLLKPFSDKERHPHQLYMSKRRSKYVPIMASEKPSPVAHKIRESGMPEDKKKAAITPNGLIIESISGSMIQSLKNGPRAGRFFRNRFLSLHPSLKMQLSRFNSEMRRPESYTWRSQANLVLIDWNTINP